MALPLTMLRSLQMRTSVKIGLTGIFCCALVTIAFDLARTVETAINAGTAGPTALWTNLESAVAVIVSCLPSFAALLRPKSDGKTGRRVVAYPQRSLAVSASARLVVNGGRGVKVGKDSPVSVAQDSVSNSYGVASSSIV